MSLREANTFLPKGSDVAIYNVLKIYFGELVYELKFYAYDF